MNASTGLVLAVIVLAVAGVLFFMHRRRKKADACADCSLRNLCGKPPGNNGQRTEKDSLSKKKG